MAFTHLRLSPVSIDSQETCGAAFDVFGADKSLTALAVLQEERVVGLLTRHHLVNTFARPIMRDVYERRPVTLLMERSPVVVDNRISLTELSARLQERPDISTHGFVVLENGKFRGVGALLDLLQLQFQEANAYGRKLEEARAEAERANAAKSVFLASMSHELRTPLNAIIGFADMIQARVYGSDAKAWERYFGYVSDISESGYFLMEVINNILDLSKASSGRMELDEELVQVCAVLRHAARMIGQRAEAAGIALVIEPVDPDLGLHADDLKLRQVVLNFLSNAVKFTPAGGEIRVSATHDEGGNLLIAVADTGAGIAPEDLERVFEPFRQARSILLRGRGGTGLGLPLSRSFVELHGGEVRLESTVGKGTRVTAMLPAARVRGIAAALAAEELGSAS